MANNFHFFFRRGKKFLLEVTDTGILLRIIGTKYWYSLYILYFMIETVYAYIFLHIDK